MVTGASGYIGRYVTQSLADQNNEVYALLRDASTVSFSSGVKIIEGDIWSLEDHLLSDIAKDAILIHLAWQDGFVHSSDKHMEQLSLHFKFVERLISFGLAKFVGLGTMHELGPVSGKVSEDVIPQPRNQYGIAKNALRLSLEELCNRKNVQYLWLRCFYIFGDDSKNSSVFSKMLELEAEGAASISLTQGTTKFDFIDVTDLGKLIAAISTVQGLTGVVNIGSGKVMTLRERIELFKLENQLQLQLNFGAFPERQGISEGCWPDLARMNNALAQK